MHSIGLTLFLNSNCCKFELCSANFIHCTVLLLTTNGRYRPFKLVSSLFMHSSDLDRILNRHFCKSELYSSIFMHCIGFPLLSAVITDHLSSSISFDKSCSCCSQQSLLYIRAPFCYIYAFHRPTSHSSFLRILVLF